MSSNHTTAKKPLVIAVVGPTASGKSALAVDIARAFGGEIISADSRQVYRGLDVGTGKITAREMRGIPHHMIDIASPRRRYTAAHFVRDASRAINRIHKRGRVPVVVGGTGFWIDTLLFGISLPNVEPNKKLRRTLEQKSPEELFRILQKLDPIRARGIDRKNPRRLIRAIEIARALGRVPPIVKRSPYRVLLIGIQREPSALRALITKRLKKRVQTGLFEEGRALRRNGLSWKRFYELGLEYRFIADVLRGRAEKRAALEALDRAIRDYARRQLVWFRRNPHIRWIKTKNEAFGLVSAFLRKMCDRYATQPPSRSTDTA